MNVREVEEMIDGGASISAIAKRFRVARATASKFVRGLSKEYQDKVSQNARKRSGKKAAQSVIPEGFAEDAKTMTADQLCKKYRKRKDTVLAWRGQLGIGRFVGSKKNRLPSIVVELANTMTIAEIASLIGWQSVPSLRSAMADEYPEAFEMAKLNARINYPDEFVTLARSMTVTQAAEKWRKDAKTIRRWARKVGGGLLQAMINNNKPAIQQHRRQGISAQKVQREEFSIRELAMNHIRRTPGFVCYSDRIYGGKGDVFYVGSMKMDYAGMMDFARKHGFSLA